VTEQRCIEERNDSASSVLYLRCVRGEGCSHYHAVRTSSRIIDLTFLHEARSTGSITEYGERESKYNVAERIHEEKDTKRAVNRYSNPIGLGHFRSSMGILICA
jgi:hypothetical protein